MFTDHIERTKRLETEFEDFKRSHKRLEEDNINLRRMFVYLMLSMFTL